MMTAGAPIWAARITASASPSCALGLARCGASSVSRIRTLFVGDVAAHKYCLPAQNPAKHLPRFRFLVELLPNPFGYVDSVKQDRKLQRKGPYAQERTGNSYRWLRAFLYFLASASNPTGTSFNPASSSLADGEDDLVDAGGTYACRPGLVTRERLAPQCEDLILARSIGNEHPQGHDIHYR